MESREQRRVRIIVMVAVVGLLLTLLAVQIVGQHSATVALFLLPLFLFEEVEIREHRWSAVLADDELRHPSPARPSLFQRPPPVAIA
jgi:hypothetical protein